MKVPRSSAKSRARRSIVHLLFTFILTTVMITTAGFGAFPENSLTETFQAVIGENFPPEILIPYNSYMEKVSAPQISLRPDSESDSESQPDPLGALVKLFETETSAPVTDAPTLVNSTLAAIESTQTQIAFIQSAPATWTQAATQTQATSASVTSTVPVTATQAATPVWIYLPSTATLKPEPAQTDTPLPTFSPTNTSTSTFTFTPTSTPTNTPTNIPGHLTLYFGAISAGNIGPRSSTDGLCMANLPAGYSNYHAFIGYTALDSIANMPSNFGVAANLPIQSVTNVVLANNWADLLDGNIAFTLDAAGVTGGNDWWSGAENADGSHLDGITADCSEWTSNSNIVGGNAGYRALADPTWMDYGFSAACDQLLAVLCIAY